MTGPSTPYIFESFDDAEYFIRSVRPFLEIHEEENGLFLGSLAAHETNPDLKARFMAATKLNNQTVFAAFYREINLILSNGPIESLEPIAIKLKELGIDVPGVVGPSKVAEKFAETWSKIRGCSSVLAMDSLLYKLIEVIWPDGISGRMRPVGSADFDLLTDWGHEFVSEALPHEPYTRDQARKSAEQRIQSGATFVWEVEGHPVSMAALARPTRNGITVNAVYTPKDMRCKGYATALVAAVSNEGLKRGKNFCTLFTDAANPTSNSIYQKIGYKPVCSSRNYRFHYDSNVSLNASGR